MVTIARVEAVLLNLPCKMTFVLAGGTYAQAGQPTPRVIVKVTGSNGISGWGEVTPCPTWTYETSESILSTIRSYLAPAVLGLEAWNLDAINRKMDRAIMPGVSIGMPLAKSGIDIAVHDLLARSLGVPLYQLFGSRRVDRIQLGYILSAETPKEYVELTNRALDIGYEAFKVKIGIHGERDDFEIVRQVRATIGEERFLWVDANQGYRLDEAMRQAKRLGELGVACFEQPLRGNSISNFKRLVDSSPVPIGLDETIRYPSDLLEYVEAGAIDIAIAKVQRSGGLWWCRQFCEIAEAAGIKLMGSGLCETDLGMLTSVHLYAAFGMDTPVDLNGRQFVESAYLASHAEVEFPGPWCKVPDGPGIGVEVDEEKLRHYAVEPC